MLDGSITVGSVLTTTPLVLMMGVGTTAGVAAMALALLPALRAPGCRLRFSSLATPRRRRDAAPVGVDGRLRDREPDRALVVLVLANGTDGGPFVYIGAYAFFQLPHGLFAVSLMTTFTPELASAATRGDLAALRMQAVARLRLAALVIVPGAALYIALARPIIVALLQRGAFDAGDASRWPTRWLAFAVGLLPFSIYLFSLRAFYSRHDTFTPFWINCIENVVNIALAFPLYAWLGIPGPRARVLRGVLGAAVITLGVVHRRLGGIDGARLTSTLKRIVAPRASSRAGVSWVVGEPRLVDPRRGVLGGRRRGPRRRRRLPAAARAADARLEELVAVRALVPAPAAAAARSEAARMPRIREAERCNDADASPVETRREQPGRPSGFESSPTAAATCPTDADRAAGIEIVPLTIRFGDEELVDREELSTDEFWQRLDEHRRRCPRRGAVAGRVRGGVPRASRRRAPPASCASTCRRTCRRRCSRRRSRPGGPAPTCPVAVDRLAQSASMGLGNLCLTAARRAADGDSLESIVAEVVDRRDRTKLFGDPRHARVPQEGRPRRQRPGAARLDAVDQAHHRDQRRRGRGGRQGPHPLEGAAAARGEGGRGEPVEHLAVLHGDAPDLDELLDLLAPVFPRDEIVTGLIGPVIGTHAGPRVIGVTFQVVADVRSDPGTARS